MYREQGCFYNRDLARAEGRALRSNAGYKQESLYEAAMY